MRQQQVIPVMRKEFLARENINKESDAIDLKEFLAISKDIMVCGHKIEKEKKDIVDAEWEA